MRPFPRPLVPGAVLMALLIPGCSSSSSSTTTTTAASKVVTESAPTASFTFSPSSPGAGQAVAFTDASSGSPTSWSWNFGDGATSTSQNPTHGYSANGTYTVSLTASNAGGSGKASSQTVTVASAPAQAAQAAAFLFTTLGTKVSFTDASSAGPVSWSWTFGDGTTSTSQGPTHTYGSGGTYTVALSVAYPSGSTSSASQTLTVAAGPATAPLASFSYTTSAPAVGQVLQFTDASSNLPASWSWNFGDGTSSTSRNPTHAFGKSGTYTVVLTASNASGTNSFSQTLTASATAGSAPTAAYASSPSAPVNGQVVTFTDQSTGSPSSWSWSFGDSSTASVSDSQNPVHVFASPGTYTVTLVPANASGAATPVSQTLTVAASTSAPASAFLVAPASPAAQQTVVFTDLSAGGPTTWSWTFGDDGSTSADPNPVHVFAGAGTYKVSLTATNAAGSTSSTQSVTVGSALPVDTNPYTLGWSLTDQGQGTTLSFDGLAMVTGNLQAQSFFPPGKVADYTGFQYFRDNTPDGLGHNTNFMTYLSNDVLSILNDGQLAQLRALGIAQQNDINTYALKRYALMKAFRRQMEGDIPAGSTGLNLDAVKRASMELYLIDGQIAFDRAMLYASIYASMAGGTPSYTDPSTTQLACLQKLEQGFSTWPVLSTDPLNALQARMNGLENGVVVAMSTYAGDIYTWYAGNVDSDIYFCPERHGTYYGGFYVKDGPAIGVPGYQISTSITASAGTILSDPTQGYVTSSQASLMNTLVNLQRNNLYAGTPSIVGMRTEIATLLRSLRTSTANSEVIRARVLELSGIYGLLDGEDNYNYASIFAQVYGTLTSAQKASLASFRQSMLTGTYADGTPFDFTTCMTYYLYSGIIMDTSTLFPFIDDTDHLFFEP